MSNHDLASLFRSRIRQAAEHARRRLKRETADVLPSRRHLRKDIVAGLPGAISSVPDGMVASVLAGVNPAHGLYASFVGPVAGGFMSSTRLMVVTTTSAAALAAGSVLATYDEADRSGAMVLPSVDSIDDAGGRLYLTGVDPALAAGWERDGTVRRFAGVRVVPATPRLGESTRAALAATAGRDPHGSVHHVQPADTRPTDARPSDTRPTDAQPTDGEDPPSDPTGGP